MTNSSTRPASLHSYLSYRDAPAALRWLQRAFGFEVTMEAPDDHGGIMHSELRLGDAAVVVFSDDGGDYDRPALKGESVGHGLYISVPDDETVDRLFASAVEAGATVVWKPGPTEWGSYRFRVHDLEGYEWTFGTHKPGLTQEDWSDADWQQA